MTFVDQICHIILFIEVPSSCVSSFLVTANTYRSTCCESSVRLIVLISSGWWSTYDIGCLLKICSHHMCLRKFNSRSNLMMHSIKMLMNFFKILELKSWDWCNPRIRLFLRKLRVIVHRTVHLDLSMYLPIFEFSINLSNILVHLMIDLICLLQFAYLLACCHLIFKKLIFKLSL